MGLLNDLWWLAGAAFAAPPAVVGVESVARGEWLLAVLFFGLALTMLLLPEYVRRRLFGSSGGGLASVPVVGRLWK